jgi:hypothetical protein
MEFRHIALSTALLTAAIGFASAAQAQTGERINRGRTAVTPDYYTQLHAAIDVTPQPQTGKQARNAFRSILAGLGGRSSAQSVAASVKVSIGDLQLPEYLLAAYDYNADTRTLSTYSTAGHDFPRKHLESGDRITVDVIFRDSDRVQYKLGDVSDAILSLVPGSALVSAASRPFVQGMGRLGSSVLTAFGSSTTNITHRYELSPLGDNNKQVDLPLANQDGQVFATVHLLLKASPTLLRDGSSVFSATPGDFRLGPGEDPATLEANIGGVKARYLDEAKGLKSYGQLVGAPGLANIEAFCSEARSFLGTEQGLAPMDSTSITLRALNEAGFDDRKIETAWFHKCFSPVEKQLLAFATGVDTPLPRPAVPDPIDNNTLWALGCWMLATGGPECARHAPDPEHVLDSAFQDRIRYSIDSSFLDTLAWGDGESVAKADLISSLKASASQFGCFQRGMLITAKERVFRFTGESEGGKIRSIAIRPAPQDAVSCTG